MIHRLSAPMDQMAQLPDPLLQQIVTFLDSESIVSFLPVNKAIWDFRISKEFRWFCMDRIQKDFISCWEQAAGDPSAFFLIQQYHGALLRRKENKQMSFRCFRRISHFVSSILSGGLPPLPAKRKCFHVPNRVRSLMKHFDLPTINGLFCS